MSTSGPENTRDRILAHALDLFNEHGVERTSLQQIADLTGVTKAALYYYFRAKEDLVAALVEPAYDEMDRILVEFPDEPPSPRERREALELYVDYLLQHRRLVSWLSRDVAALATPAIACRVPGNKQRLERVLGGDTDDLATSIRVAVLIGGLRGAIATHAETDPAELRDALLRTAKPLLGAGRGRVPAHL
jgi:AcrR family transcriptional regulator